MGFFKWFSFDWLTSAERKELEALRKEKEIRNIEKVEVNEIKPVAPEKEYKNLFYNGENLTVVFRDNTINTFECSPEQYLVVECMTKKQEIIELFTPVSYKEEYEHEEEVFKINEEQRETLQAEAPSLLETGLFEKKEDGIYLKGVNLPVPEPILASFLEIHEKKILTSKVRDVEVLEEQFEALRLFWIKLALNPIDSARNDLMRFVTRNDIKITKRGNFVGYRRIVSVNNNVDKTHLDFISASVIKVKGWKKSPKKYDVYFEEGKYEIVEIGKKQPKLKEKLGNLGELYDNLSNDETNRYTDAHTKKYDIRIGSVYKIKEEDLDLVHFQKSCGGALHLSDGKNYSYGSFGDTPVACIVNPMHVVKMDTGTTGKIGVRQMFIAGVVNMRNGQYEHIDDKTLVDLDEQYDMENMAELEEIVKNKQFNKLDVKKDKVKVDEESISNILKILSERVIAM